MRTPQEIKTLFLEEFDSLQEKFEIIIKPISDVKEATDEFIWKPGCYIWWDPRIDTIKFGRSLTNSRKRALEHLTADYGDPRKNKLIASMVDNPDSKLILFNVKDENDLHWVAAFEIYMEKELNPKIHSERLG